MKTLQILAVCLFFAATVSAQNVTPTPNSGTQGNTTLAIQISGNGTNFYQATLTNVVFFQGSSTQLYGYNSTVNSATWITTYIDIPYSANTGLYNLGIDLSGSSYISDSVFTVLAGPVPQITYVDTNYSSLGTTLDVTISGTNTNFQSGSSTVWFSQGSATIYPNLVSVTSPVSLIANITIPSGGPAGFYDVNVYDPTDNTLTLPYGFFVSDSMIGIVSVTGDSTTYNLGDSNITILITGAGTNFAVQGDTTTVWLGQVHRSEVPNIFAVSTHVLSNTQISATFHFPANFPSGYYDLFLYNTIDGELTKERAVDLISTGITNTAADKIKIYPNPASGKLFIESADQVITSISMTSLDGTLVLKRSGALSNQEVLDLTSIDAGIYILAITGQSGIVSYKKILVE